MADLRKSDYRDPAEIYERKEARTCRGCAYQTRLWGVVYCVKTEKAGDKRCAKYKDAC